MNARGKRLLGKEEARETKYPAVNGTVIVQSKYTAMNSPFCDGPGIRNAQQEQNYVTSKTERLTL